MTYAIIKDAGPPPPRKGRDRIGAPIYPFATMEVWDAFDVPRDGKAKDGKADKVDRRVRASATSFEKRNPGTEFSTRLWDETTVRCWRVA